MQNDCTIFITSTVLLAAGATRRAPPSETAATLPEGSAITEAMAEIDNLFGDSGETSVVTLLFRGEAITPEGLSQMDALINDIAGDPDVGDLLARTRKGRLPPATLRRSEHHSLAGCQ